MSENEIRLPSSFRDPSGFLFKKDGILYRQINFTYKENYNQLMGSGLYEKLVSSNLLIPHKETDNISGDYDNTYKIIKPELIEFISYPYEWGFSQLKDAALVTLAIQKKALKFNMSLKDCSAYNIQFREGKPLLIDTLSFEKYQKGKPWVAYRQFCQHFLAPLALMAYKDIRLGRLFLSHIDGIPLDLTSSLLPFWTWLKPSLSLHLHLHYRSEKYFADKNLKKEKIKKKFSKSSFLALINSLESLIKNLKWETRKTEWRDYYDFMNYSLEAINEKKQIVARFLEKAQPKNVWDLGANTGLFSRIASDRGIRTISFDIDPVCVEKNYLECKKNNEDKILPLIIDLTNPSPSIGWENKERLSLLGRGPADAVFALALIHHLAFSNNLSLEKIVDFFRQICRILIIEFVPKNDSQAQKLLGMKGDFFPNYRQDLFEEIFSRYFKIEEFVKIKDSKRSLYLMFKR